MSYYHGKHVLLTGAASGIGRLMAQKMGAQGARLILWDVNRRGLEETGKLLKDAGVTAHTYVCDLSSRVAIRETAAQTLAECERVDILVNNAGIVSGRNILDLTEEQIIRTFEVNTLALYWTSKAFLPGMIERKNGHIVTVSSAGGICATARMTDYCASKFAAFGFDDALRVELKRNHFPIHTTVVCPFYLDTGMFRGVKTRFGFLLPILKPDYVANRIVSAVANRKHRLVMPKFVLTAFLSRVLPVPVFDWIMDFLGVSKSMDEFTGRSGRH